jgi:hypothetical protein
MIFDVQLEPVINCSVILPRVKSAKCFLLVIDLLSLKKLVDVIVLEVRLRFM